MYRRHFISASVWVAATGLSPLTDAASSPEGRSASTARTILVLGDSLSAEYGLKRGSGWVALLEQRLKSERVPATVVNASISGDTTAGGRARLAGLLTKHKPTHLVIELGANDALRGLPLKLTENNLVQMTTAAQNADAKVLLLGMQIPPNYGSDYAARFAGLFAAVAKANQVALVPFLLRGIADTPNSARLFQTDRIHPNEEAQPIMLGNVWPELKKQLK